MGKLVQLPSSDLLLDQTYSMATCFAEGLPTTQFAKSANVAIDATVIHNPCKIAVTHGEDIDNVEDYLASAGKPLLFANLKPIEFATMVEFAEAETTGEVGLFIGMTSGTIANLLTDDGAGILTPQSAAAFVAVDGDTNLSCMVQNGAAGTRQIREILADNEHNVSRADAPISASTPRRFKIEVLDNEASGSLEVVFWIDGYIVDRFRLDPTSAAVMAWVILVKAGDDQAQNAWIHNVRVAQKRAALA